MHIEVSVKVWAQGKVARYRPAVMVATHALLEGVNGGDYALGYGAVYYKDTGEFELVHLGQLLCQMPGVYHHLPAD